MVLHKNSHFYINIKIFLTTPNITSTAALKYNIISCHFSIFLLPYFIYLNDCAPNTAAQRGISEKIAGFALNADLKSRFNKAMHNRLTPHPGHINPVIL